MAVNVPALFAKWIRENESRFAIKLVRTPYKKGKGYTFEGIPDNLSVWVDDGGIVVWVYLDGNAVDMLRDIDAVLAYKAGKGYYCNLCIAPEYFPTIESFYIKHCFEDLLEWINTKLATAKYCEICFAGGRNGTSWAFLDNQFRKRTGLRKFMSSVRSMFRTKKEDMEKIVIKLKT